MALKLMPDQPKALFRRGLARKRLGKVARAREGEFGALSWRLRVVCTLKLTRLASRADFLAAKKAGAGDEADRELAALGDGSEEAKVCSCDAFPPR